LEAFDHITLLVIQEGGHYNGLAKLDTKTAEIKV